VNKKYLLEKNVDSKTKNWAGKNKLWTAQSGVNSKCSDYRQES